MEQTSTLSRTNTQHYTVWNGQTVVDWLACVWTRRLHWPVWPLLPFVSSISPKWSINTSPFSCCKSLLHHKDTDLDNKRQHLITNPSGSHSTVKGIAARRYIYLPSFFCVWNCYYAVTHVSFISKRHSRSLHNSASIPGSGWLDRCICLSNEASAVAFAAFQIFKNNLF